MIEENNTQQLDREWWDGVAVMVVKYQAGCQGRLHAERCQGDETWMMRWSWHHENPGRLLLARQHEAPRLKVEENLASVENYKDKLVSESKTYTYYFLKWQKVQKKISTTWTCTQVVISSSKKRNGICNHDQYQFTENALKIDDKHTPR